MDAYCKVTEHRINTAKSTIFFNTGAGRNERKKLEEVLNIVSTRDMGKYLGLPSIWGVSRKEALGYLKNKIWDKLAEWRPKTLNQTEKDVLIKVVITVIPMYVMSVLQLPKT